MDIDANGTVDLADFRAFQLCFDSPEAGCLAAFDRALDCGLVDLSDYFIFNDQISGPLSGTIMALDGGFSMSEMVEDTEQAAPPEEMSVGDQNVTTAGLAIEVRPTSGGEPVCILRPHSAYELRYAAEADGTSWYLLIAASKSTMTGLDLVEPALTGPWGDAEGFLFEDILETYGELPPAPLQPDLVWTDSASHDGQLQKDTEDQAPASGQLCIITTGDPGELSLEVYMMYLAPDSAAVFMDASTTLMVEE